MNYKVNDIIRFNSGEYIILNVFSLKRNTYLYLINNDKNYNDVSIVKVKRKKEEIIYSSIVNDEEFKYVVSKLFIEYKNDILKLLEN